MSRKTTHSEFVQWMKELHPNLVVVGQYEGANTPVKVYCKVCGQYSDPRPSNLKGSKNRNPTGCKWCANNVPKTDAEFREAVLKACPDVEPLDSYPGNNKSVMRFRCKRCGNSWLTSAQSVLQGHGCKLCKSKVTGESRRITQEEFESRVAKNSPDVIVCGEYIGAHSPILAECRRCHHHWNPIAQNLANGSGCPNCGGQGSSFTERFIYHALCHCLGDSRVLYRNRTAIGMELDILVPDFNFAVEPGSWYWHNSLVERDAEKRRLCKERGIRLVTVYDGLNTGERPFAEDCYTYGCNLGIRRNRKVLRSLVLGLLRDMGVQHNFSESEWRQIAREANVADELDEAAFRKFVSDSAPNIAIEGPYNGSRTEVLMRCTKGHPFTSVPKDFVKNPRCPKCSQQRANQIRMISRVEFERRVYESNPNIEIIGEYKGMGHRVAVRCTTCNREWSPLAGDVSAGHGCRKVECRRLTKLKMLENTGQMSIELRRVSDVKHLT